MKKPPSSDSSRFCNWLLGIRAACGTVWECDVEAEAVIGGKAGIIRGGWIGLKLPKQQAGLRSDTRRTKSVEVGPPTCVRQDEQVGKCNQRGENSSVRASRARVKSEVQDKPCVFVRAPFSPFFPSLGAEKRAELSFSGGFFLFSFFLFKGEYFRVRAFAPSWSTRPPRSRSSHPGRTRSP